MSVTSSKNAIEPFFASDGATNGTSNGATNGATVGAGLVPARKIPCCNDEMKGMPRQTARCAIVETGYIPSHQRNATPNEVVRTETGCIPSLPPGTDLLAAGGHKTRPYDFGEGLMFGLRGTSWRKLFIIYNYRAPT